MKERKVEWRDVMQCKHILEVLRESSFIYQKQEYFWMKKILIGFDKKMTGLKILSNGVSEDHSI